MRQRKFSWMTLPGGRIKRLQGRRSGEKQDRFGRHREDRRSERRAFRQAFRTEWSA